MTSRVSLGRNFRKGMGAMIAGTLALTLAACSGMGGSAPEEVDIPVGGVDDGATMTLWVRAAMEKQARLLVDTYNGSHENNVELTVVPSGEYVTKIGAAAGSNGLPDLIAGDVVYIPSWAEQGLLRDVTEQVDALAFADQINQGHIDAGTIEGKKHALPLVLDLSMLFWNKDLVAEAGFDPEKAPATLEEYAAIAQGVQALNKPGVYGTAVPLNCGGCLTFTGFPSIWADGAEPISEDGKSSNFTDPSATNLFATWNKLWTAGAMLPSSPDEAGATWVAGFQEGNVGIQMYPATLLGSIDFEVGVSGIPGVTGGESTFAGGDSIGISRDSKNVSQAWNFLEWLMSEEAQVEVLAKNKDVVVRGDLVANKYAEADPRLVKINEVAATGRTPISLNYQQAFNSPSSPWLNLVRGEVLGDGGTVEKFNNEISEILAQ